ncbi:MAG: hypothetical protein ACK4L7_11330 [Flavobacteriales bacterium]
MPVKGAAAIAADLLGGSKKTYYQICLDMQKQA